MQLSSRTIVQCTFVLATLLSVVAASCAHGTKVGGPGETGSSSGSPGSSSGVSITPPGSSSGVVVSGGNMCTGAKCRDFDMSPIMDPNGMPSSDPSQTFGGPNNSTSNNAPCLVEPADGSLYPKNWLRPRIVWKPGSNAQNLFEVRIHSDFEDTDLVVYTTQTYWTMDDAIWQSIAYAPSATDGGVGKDGDLITTDLTVTVRASSGSGTPAASSTAKFTIAPAAADGALVYWTTQSFDNSATNTTLQGFHVRDEGTTLALQSSQVQQPVRATPVDGGNLSGNFQQVFCIGCHTATPDGAYVAFTAQWPWPATLASIQSTSTGTVPPWLSKGAIQNLSPDYRGNAYDTWYNPPAVNQIMLGIGTFSPAHYTTGDRVYVATLGTSWNSFSLSDPGVASGVTSQLAWFNLEWDNSTTMTGGFVSQGLPAATPCTTGTYPGINGTPQSCLPTPVSDGGWGVIARNGDSRGAGSPSWSHNVDGQTDYIAYSSTNTGVKDGRMDCSTSSSCVSDVYVVQYGAYGQGVAGGAGGMAIGLPGASDSNFNEYYPSWSPDDQFIAFNRVPAGTSMYNQAKAEVYVVPFNNGTGGTATPITSSFPPPSCTNPFPDGVQNTWPKWAPNPLDANGKPVAQTDSNGTTYYWLTFSSIRSPQAPPDPTNSGKRKQQLYLAGVTVDKNHNVKAFAPIYMWNQNAAVNNLIPAWGEFSIAKGSQISNFMPPQ